jgi:hypothetical protein
MIISDKPSAPPKQLPSPPIIEPKKSHSVIVDNSKVPIDSLITHVSGIALTVDYYRLIVNKDTALYSQDVGQSGVQQQYQLYKNFEITRIALPEIDFRIVCSKGTYIRSIAYDFGLALNSGGHLTSLRRTKIGDYSVENGVEPEAFIEALQQSPSE